MTNAKISLNHNQTFCDKTLTPVAPFINMV